MGYPQTISSQAVLGGEEFWRLFTPIDSSGDIYEMDISAKAFCIGPQSDLARVRISYYDPNVPSSSQSFVVSVGDYFLGRVDSAGSSKYPGANVGARILISPEDLVENAAAIMNNYVVLATTPNVVDVIAYNQPNLDLLSYLSQPTTLPDNRADRYLRGFVNVADRGGGTGVSYLLVPYYGRKLASIKLTNFTPNPYTVVVVGSSIDTFGVNSLISPDVTSQAIILSTTAVASHTTAAPTIRASVNGFWDYLVVMISGDVLTSKALLYEIQTSDVE